MDMELISTEKIKPASATPDDLKIYKISLLDQFIIPVYTPIVLYFSGGGDEESIRLLKDSLSATLATFYPYAGVNRDFLSVDCNDEGVPFAVAKVSGEIKDFLRNPNFELMNKFFPSTYNPEAPMAPGGNTMMIQVNCFECGGMAIAMLCAHFVADITSVCTFIRSWAANALGEAHTAAMNRTAQSSFPQKASVPTEVIPAFAISKFMSMGKYVTRRYVFDTSALSILKEESRSSDVPTPTRVSVVSAVIWKCFMTAVAEINSAAKPFVMAQAVNLRRRAAPPFPKESFGNFVWIACTLCANHEEVGLKELVAEMKKDVAKIDEEFMRRVQEDEFLEEMWKKMPQEAEGLVFTSWFNTGLYDDVDFGWGKPVWMSRNRAQHDTESVTMLPNNVVVLMDRRDGDGIEVWVNIDKKYVEGFERNELIRKYARLNPSVI